MKIKVIYYDKDSKKVVGKIFQDFGVKVTPDKEGNADVVVPSGDYPEFMDKLTKVGNIQINLE